MTLTTPKLYFGTTEIQGTTAADLPVLSGLTIDWGNESLFDFAPPATLAGQILLKPGFVLNPAWGTGTPVGLMDTSGKTLFAGRIATMKAQPDERIKGATLLSFTAADTLVELGQYRLEVVQWGELKTAYERRAQLRGLLPAGWALLGPDESAPGDLDWNQAMAQRWVGKEWLMMLDLHLRGTRSRRHNTTRYVPTVGLDKRITITPERLPGVPPAGTVVVYLTAGQLGADLEWEKTPDDLVTSVKLNTYAWNAFATEPDEESAQREVWVNNHINVNTAALQAAYGVHELEIDIDTDAGAPATNPYVGYLVNFWLNADNVWRPTAITLADTTALADATVLDLIDVTKRGMVYVILADLPANPANVGRLEAYSLGGKATWTGKKWTIELTLGRVNRTEGTPVGA